MASQPTAAAESGVEFRQPKWVVRWNRGVLCVIVGIAIFTAVQASRGDGGVLVVDVLMWLVLGCWAWFTRRSERAAIVSDGDTLVVTNALRVHRVARRDIVGVGTTRTRLSLWGPQLEIRLRDGTSVWPGLVVRQRSRDADTDDDCRQAIQRWVQRPSRDTTADS